MTRILITFAAVAALTVASIAIILSSPAKQTASPRAHVIILAHVGGAPSAAAARAAH
jgi:hypothetical protein